MGMNTEDDEFARIEREIKMRAAVPDPIHHTDLGETLEYIQGWNDCRATMVAEQPAQQEPEFFTHCVDQPYDWSEWVCPDPKSYLFKCCDCGLVHEAEFGVVRYKSDTDREDCDMVNDPNLQAVFRMRRSEQWSPEDTAHRAGGLTMEQPAQQALDKMAENARELGLHYDPAQHGPVHSTQISKVWWGVKENT